MSLDRGTRYKPIPCPICGKAGKWHRDGHLCHTQIDICPIRKEEHTICLACKGEGTMYAELI